MKLFAALIIVLGLTGLATAIPSYFPYRDYLIVFSLLLVIVNLIVSATD
jgi:hypothetical protein